MRIHVFTHRYPVAFKPYYDTQFADLVRSGHELIIFAAGGDAWLLNGKVVRYRLLERTRRFPTTLSTIPRHLAGMATGVAADPATLLRDVRGVVGVGGGVRRTIAHVARMLTVRGGRPDLCLVHGLGTALMFPWLGRIHPGTPVAMYYHGGEVPLVRPHADAAAADAFGRMDVIFTNTEFSRRQAIERGAPPDRVHVLPVGFALEDFDDVAPRSYRPGGRLRLLAAGRLSEEKGLRYALEALALLVNRGIIDVQLAVAGDGYDRASLEQFVRDNGLERYVGFLGTLPADHLSRVMAQADVLLLPSVPHGNWMETQACVVQEAMLMRAIVVTTAIGGVPESIPPQMRRFMVPPGDAPAIARAIAAIRDLDPADLAALGRAGRAFVARNYDIRRLNERMLRIALRSAPGRVPGAPRSAPVTRPVTAIAADA